MSSGQNILSGLFGAQAKRGGWQPNPSRPGRLPVIVLIVAVLALWGVLSAFYTVQPEQRAVVKRFGAVVNIADPGLHFKLPFGIDQVQLVATERVLKEEFGFRTIGESQPTRYADSELPDESLMLSGDLNMIDAEWVVQYRIADPVKFLYAMREPVRTLRDISESVMRRAVGNRLGSDVLTTARTEIAESVELEIQQAMDRYDNGIRIVTVQLQDVVPPKAVRPAFNEVNEARQERERMINEATKQANQRVPLARGQANRVIAEAEGYATERVNNALGETARFRSILAEYRSAPDVTRTRMYLETLNQVLPDVGQVLVMQKGQVSPLPLLNLRDARPAATVEAK
ncbi:MAG: FtsH protease activity modulator HflK [Lysobacterales bacterium CG17_big_fil_post_rev_8_21_14_2_50_64_11]|nr:MAG: FtsH protease activity modulator HflK [Xanthomonadales bacterium CG17_big_fil_post_rev_8_21_14_2_50_64_11]PIX61018.1 MAG: FtsH protease activity modulator HflK [Xanthomonadales bacterium CG_4_10_14_3_um_filter_64_11]